MQNRTELLPCPCGGCDVQGRSQPEGTAKHWADDDGPALVLGRSYGGWLDHTYRLFQQETIWVAEPYELYAEAFAEMAKLVEAGFNVVIRARDARHLPGVTVAVLVTKAGTR